MPYLGNQYSHDARQSIIESTTANIVMILTQKTSCWLLEGMVIGASLLRQKQRDHDFSIFLGFYGLLGRYEQFKEF